jgi:dTMP kinase
VGSQPATGRYLVIEGGEGVGKTTQVQLLADRLRESGVDAAIVREPGGDAFAEAGRELLLGPLPREPETEVLLFNALRAQVLKTRVAPSLAAGTWVVADRSQLSTIAYQGYGHGLDLGWTRSVCATVAGLCRPSLELILDLDLEAARARRDARGTTDRFEQLDDSFHERVREGYRREAAERGIALLDAAGPVGAVAEAIWSHVAPLLPR